MCDLDQLHDQLLALRNEAMTTGDRILTNHPVTGKEDAQYHFGRKDGLERALCLVMDLAQQEVIRAQTCETD